MNDILPKPFTQDGLLEMLKVFFCTARTALLGLLGLIALVRRNISCTSKVIQQMVQIPRLGGVPLLSDSAFEQALAVSASNNSLMAAGGSDEMDRTYSTFEPP
jgi:osomolarity two-component system response regulator SKN7